MADSHRTMAWAVATETEKKPRSLREPGAKPRQDLAVVALKMILPGPLATPDFLARFQNEARAAATLDHPNVVSIHEVGEVEGQPYYTMRLIEGLDLAKELERGGALSNRRAAEIMARVARAVHYAHQRGVLHRDLKPANILLDAEGRPHVTDFGLAKLVEEDQGLTRSSASLGTPSYMAPEQAAGHARDVTTAADIYSLGAILFEALTGERLFAAPTPLGTIKQVLEQEARPASSVNRSVPADLDTICLKCLEKELHRRYRTALELVEDLEHWLAGEPIRARQVRLVERMWLPGSTRWSSTAAVASWYRPAAGDREFGRSILAAWSWSWTKNAEVHGAAGCGTKPIRSVAHVGGTASPSGHLRYADGSHHEHEAVYGRDLRNWWWGNQGDIEAEAERATVAWVGTNPVSERYEAKVRLFLSTFENPKPEVEVVSVDFVSKLTPFAPFLVAMTVEE